MLKFVPAVNYCSSEHAKTLISRHTGRRALLRELARGGCGGGKERRGSVGAGAALPTEGDVLVVEEARAGGPAGGEQAAAEVDAQLIKAGAQPGAGFAQGVAVGDVGQAVREAR